MNWERLLSCIRAGHYWKQKPAPLLGRLDLCHSLDHRLFNVVYESLDDFKPQHGRIATEIHRDRGGVGNVDRGRDVVDQNSFEIAVSGPSAGNIPYEIFE